MNQIVAENKKLQSDMVIVKNVNSKLEEKIVYEKNQTKRKQYSRRNNVEISVIPNSIPDKDLGKTVISICKDSGVLPLSRNSRGQDKRVIVKLSNLSTGSTRKPY